MDWLELSIIPLKKEAEEKKKSEKGVFYIFFLEIIKASYEKRKSGTTSWT
jgi:hypothetical protein